MNDDADATAGPGDGGVGRPDETGQVPGANEPSSGGDDDAYGGVLGAVPYAFRASDSYLFGSYAALGGLLALAVALLFGLALVDLLGATVGVTGGTFSFSRAFFVLVGLAVVAPLLAPVLFVARRHRRGRASRRFDFVQASLGYLFVLSVYVAAVVVSPAAQQRPVSGAVGAVVDALNALPAVAGLLPPVAVAVLMAHVARGWDRS